MSLELFLNAVLLDVSFLAFISFAALCNADFIVYCNLCSVSCVYSSFFALLLTLFFIFVL